MPESSTNPPPEGDEWAGFDLREFVRETIRSVEFGDMLADVLEDRVVRLEEIVAAPWWRRPFLRRRLHREIRASVATWEPAYIPRGDFRGRRMEWAMQATSARYDRRAWVPRFAQDGQHGPERPDDAPDEGTDPGAGYLP